MTGTERDTFISNFISDLGAEYQLGSANFLSYLAAYVQQTKESIPVLSVGTIGTVIAGASNATPNDTDVVATAEGSTLKKITWTNIKAFLKSYFDTQYPSGSGTSTGTNTGDNSPNSLYSGLVSNATHTGDVTGSTALTVDKTAITGKPAVTAVGADYVLISDTSDSGNLKKALVSDLSGTGSTVITRTEADLGATPVYRGSFTVIDASVTLTSKINIWQAYDALTGKGTRADENDFDSFILKVEPKTGEFTVRWETVPIFTNKIDVQGQKMNRPNSSTSYKASIQNIKRVRLGKVKGNFKFDYIVG